MHIRSYNEAREYLESFIRPSIQARFEADSGLPHPLKRMQELLRLLGNPQEKFRSIQVSGTAGKGSTSYLLSHILTTAGYKTGLTLSPHLQKINERIQINNREIDDASFITLLNQLIPSIEKLRETSWGAPSYFEILISMAFTHFAQESVDIAVVEVGLEGKLDGTNTLRPLIAVLTNIDLDHMEILGDTVEKIAEEAVSIIKGERQVVITGAKQESVRKIIEEKCLREGSELLVLSSDFTYQILSVEKTGSVFNFISEKISLKDVRLSLIGEYQIENAALAIETVLKLKQFGYSVSDAQIREALQTAAFPGRFELLSFTLYAKRYTLILDGAHNPLKMQAFLSALRKFYPKKKKIFIVTFKKGKDVAEMLRAVLDVADVLILTEFHLTIDTGKNASMESQELELAEQKLSHSKSVSVTTAGTAEKALASALATAAEGDLIVVTGSLYLVGEVREDLLGIRN